MNEIRLRNFRCFREEQKARLAPLTLLVGENSTGKTSFLALIRALWDLGFSEGMPDFKEDPYDLGSFDEIAHHRGARGGRATSFEAGFSAALPPLRPGTSAASMNRSLRITFSRDRNQAIPTTRRIADEESFLELDLSEDVVRIGTSNGRWSQPLGERFRSSLLHDERRPMIPLRFLLFSLRYEGRDDDPEPRSRWTTLQGQETPSKDDLDYLQALADGPMTAGPRPYASAPVRSKPRRTYDPSRLTRDPEGEAVPTYLADLFHRRQSTWKALHKALERFGQASGLFDEMRVRPLGKTSSAPFQIQVRKAGSTRLKGPWRNVTDVGYGVSQVLPVITELLRPDAPSMFLLQQPEVHLHPSAQAALGTLFCSVAAGGRQLVVETHGDHLIDRVRMDVRDRTTRLKPADVSILFFERRELEVQIHSLRIDDEGNILGAPASYRRFFMEETNRSIGIS